LKDLSYLKVFDQKVLRSIRRILKKGFTARDIEEFLGQPEASMTPGKAELMRKMGWELKKPCGGCKKKKEEA